MDLKLGRNTSIALAVVCIIISVIGFMFKLPRAFRGYDKEMHAGFYFLAAGFFNLLFAKRSLIRHALIFGLLFVFSVAIEHAQEYSNTMLGRTIHGRYDPEDVKYNLKGLIYFSGLWVVIVLLAKYFKREKADAGGLVEKPDISHKMTMLTAIHPKLPMRDKAITKEYYTMQLGFEVVGGDYPDYLMVRRGGIEIHFFSFADLDPKENYGQVYIRTDAIDLLYKELQDKQTPIHPNGPLTVKPWGQKEFSLLDPDHNLLTFGQAT